MEEQNLDQQALSNIAVLNKTMSIVEQGLKEIQVSIGSLGKELRDFVSSAKDTWITKQDAAMQLKETESKLHKHIEEVAKAIAIETKEIRHIATVRSWLMGGAGLLVGGIVAGLINYFFTHNN